MKYKKGDIVKIKTWEQMVEQYGIMERDVIQCGNEAFTEAMRKYAGTVMTVKSVDALNEIYKMEPDDGWRWDYTDEMIDSKIGGVSGVNHEHTAQKDGSFSRKYWEESGPIPASLKKEQGERNFKITIEHYDKIVSVGVDYPDVVITDAISLMKDALLALGYSQKQLDEYIPEI